MDTQTIFGILVAVAIVGFVAWRMGRKSKPNPPGPHPRPDDQNVTQEN